MHTWFREISSFKKSSSRNTSLLIYQVSLESIINKRQFGCEYKNRDSIGCEYIHGKEPDTDMITEEAYIFFQDKTGR
jgi:hypothetical protein